MIYEKAEVSLLKKSSIKKQALSLIISCSLMTLLLTAGVSVYGIMAIRQSAVNIGEEIGGSAAKESSVTLHEEAKAMLLRHMNERSSQIDMTFSNLGVKVRMISEQMTEMLKHKERYLPRTIEEPKKENAGKLSTQLHLAPGLNENDEKIAEEIGLTANISDWLTRIYMSSDMVVATYVASQNGFTVMVDARSDKKFLPGENAPARVDFRQRPWYEEAVKKNALLYTEPYLDAYSDNRAITCAMPYYDANGKIAGVVGAGMFLSNINTIVLSTKVGSTGYGFIMKNDGRVLFSPKSKGTLQITANNAATLLESSDENLRNIAKKMSEGEVGIAEVVVDDTPCYLAYGPLRALNASFGIVMEKDEISASAVANEELIEKSTQNFLTTLNHSMYSIFLGILVITFFLLIAVSFIGNYLAERFARPIKILNEGVREIASGNLNKKLEISTKNEIEELAASFNFMTDELKTHIDNLTRVTAERQRITTELSVATNIQESMLPNFFPAFPDRKEFDIYASMHAAKEVGGDFYDFYMIDKRHLMITIADVSGKGVPAALFMVISKTILQNYSLAVKGKISLTELVAKANDQLEKNNDAMMFVTAFVGMLNLETGEFKFVNAGHNPPLIYRAKEDKYSYLKTERNFVLGGMNNLNFKGQSINFEPGDKIFLYTDGVTEALSEEEELFGEERLLKTLNSAGVKNEGVKETLVKVKEALTSHVKKAEQSDDITMMSVIYNGMGNNEMERSNVKTLELSATLENLQVVQDFVEETIAPLKVSAGENMQIALSVEEIFVNIVNYAYGEDGGDAIVEVALLDNTKKGVEITFKDKGTPYDPLKKVDPDINAPIEDRGIGGLGIFLVKKNMDELEYKYESNENIFIMRKFF